VERREPLTSLLPQEPACGLLVGFPLISFVDRMLGQDVVGLDVCDDAETREARKRI